MAVKKFESKQSLDSVGAGASSATVSPSVALLTREEVCVFFGGTKPLNPSTLYKGIQAQRFPKPVKIGPQTSRWVRSECEDKLRELMAAR